MGCFSYVSTTILFLFYRQTVKGRNSTKLTTMVDFPVYGFDMTPHLANKHNTTMSHSNTLESHHNPVILGGVGWSPWKRPRKQSHSNDNTYDLYAVCYHHGTDLETGHYTAACKNPYDNQWYLYDDTKVTNLSPNANDIRTELVNNSAYILFYQKRSGTYVGSSSNSSSAASTSSVGSMGDHWVSRMPKFNYTPPKTDKKAVTTTTTAVEKKPTFVNNKTINTTTTTMNTVVTEPTIQKDELKCEVIEKKSPSPVSMRNSTGSSTSVRKLESKATNTDVTSLAVEEEPKKQPIYTTSIYINASGDVDITTSCVNGIIPSAKSPVVSSHRVNGLSDADVTVSLDERNGFYRGNRGYATLSTVGHRHTYSGEGDKIYHSDDEAPPVAMASSWVCR